MVKFRHTPSHRQVLEFQTEIFLRFEKIVPRLQWIKLLVCCLYRYMFTEVTIRPLLGQQALLGILPVHV